MPTHFAVMIVCVILLVWLALFSSRSVSGAMFIGIMVKEAGSTERFYDATKMNEAIRGPSPTISMFSRAVSVSGRDGSVVKAVVKRMAVTFEKRDWGSGRWTWRERPGHHRRKGPNHYALRRISNREAKRRELSGDPTQMY